MKYLDINASDVCDLYGEKHFIKVIKITFKIVEI